MNVPESFTLKYEKRSWKNTYSLGSILMVLDTIRAALLVDWEWSVWTSSGPLHITWLLLVEKIGVMWRQKYVPYLKRGFSTVQGLRPNFGEFSGSWVFLGEGVTHHRKDRGYSGYGSGSEL